jgi:phosphopantetheinyl transferase (holo-ACP synthase)
MIDGIGIDVVDIARFAESLERTPALPHLLRALLQKRRWLRHLMQVTDLIGMRLKSSTMKAANQIFSSAVK